MYRIKEAFATLQGEGLQAGRVAVFCRFSKCNLWTGREKDRATAVCQFCDTDFVGTDGQNGGVFETPEALADHIASLWPGNGSTRPSRRVGSGALERLAIGLSSTAPPSKSGKTRRRITSKQQQKQQPKHESCWCCGGR